MLPDGTARCGQGALPQMPVELAVGDAQSRRCLFDGEVVHALIE